MLNAADAAANGRFSYPLPSCCPTKLLTQIGADSWCYVTLRQTGCSWGSRFSAQLPSCCPIKGLNQTGTDSLCYLCHAAADGRFLGLALLSPAPLLVPHKMIRPYWLVKAVCSLSTKIDSLSAVRGAWRWFVQVLRLY